MSYSAKAFARIVPLMLWYTQATAEASAASGRAGKCVDARFVPSPAFWHPTSMAIVRRCGVFIPVINPIMYPLKYPKKLCMDIAQKMATPEVKKFSP